MKKVFTPINYAYLTILMVLVVGMLILNLLKESIVALFKDKEAFIHAKHESTAKKKKDTTYIITDASHSNS